MNIKFVVKAALLATVGFVVGGVVYTAYRNVLLNLVVGLALGYIWPISLNPFFELNKSKEQK